MVVVGDYPGPLRGPWVHLLAMFPWMGKLVYSAAGKIETELTELSSLKWHGPKL